jgi:hypothetical protein
MIRNSKETIQWQHKTNNSPSINYYTEYYRLNNVNPIKTGVNSDYTESVSSSCATNDIRHVILVENPVTEIQNVIRNG